MDCIDNLLYSHFNKKCLLPRQVYILFGPTATGKTKFSIPLAKKINADIINCDMAQIYSEGKIGTGQIREEEKDGVMHYLVGFMNEPLSISVYDMRIKIEHLIEFIFSKNKNVLLVGGSSFCIYSLFFSPFKFYLNLKKEAWRVGLIYDKVKISNVFASSIKEKALKDTIVFCPSYDYNIIFFDVFISDEKQFWVDCIKKRIDSFFALGWVHEIENLSLEWSEFLYRKKFIGYYELIPYVCKYYACNNKGINFDEIKDIIFFRTCQYGKKQRTFLRKMRRDFMLYDVCYFDYYNRQKDD